MKAYKILFFAILAPLFITACTNMMGYKYRKTCWASTAEKTKCGTHIKQRCEHICRKCTSNEQACTVCWECIDHDPGVSRK